MNITLTDQAVQVERGGMVFFHTPMLVQNCMNPEDFKLYPVVMSDESGDVRVRCLEGEFHYTKEDRLVIIPFKPKKPEQQGCTGKCEKCGKCS